MRTNHCVILLASRAKTFPMDGPATQHSSNMKCNEELHKCQPCLALSTYAERSSTSGDPALPQEHTSEPNNQTTELTSTRHANNQYTNMHFWIWHFLTDRVWTSTVSPCSSTWLFMTRTLKWLLIRQSNQHSIWTAYWFSKLKSLFLLLTILKVNIIKACVKPLWKAWFDDPWTFSTWPKLLLRSTISRLIALAAQLQQWLECASLKVIPMYATTRINYIATWDTVASIIVKSTTQSLTLNLLIIVSQHQWLRC